MEDKLVILWHPKFALKLNCGTYFSNFSDSLKLCIYHLDLLFSELTYERVISDSMHPKVQNSRYTSTHAVVIDKNLAEWKILKEELPKAVVLWHVIKVLFKQLSDTDVQHDAVIRRCVVY